MNLATYSKEPTAILDYEIDWTQWLAGRTISNSTWTAPTGITVVDSSISGSVTIVRLSGGTWGQSYEVTNHITASDNQEQEGSITIKIQFDVAYASVTETRAMAQAMTTDAVPSATDSLVKTMIERVSRAFDLEVGVPENYFDPPLFPFVTQKTFYGDGTNYLKPDPYIAGSLDTTLILPDGYSVPDFIEKDGYLVITLGGNIPIPGRSSIIGGLPTFGWYQGVPIKINAQWGFLQTPRDVNLAIVEWVINVWRETDTASLKLVGLDGQVLRENMPPRVTDVVRRWQMKTGVLV